MGTQLYLRSVGLGVSKAGSIPSSTSPNSKRTDTQGKGDIREILDRLAEKHGATVRDVTAAMLSIDDTLCDLLYDQERMLQHEIEDLSPV